MIVAPKTSLSPTFTVLGGQISLLRGHLNPSEESLWLAASVCTQSYKTVLDAGCGCGIIGFSLLTRSPHLMLTGMDCNAQVLQQAQKNAALNDFTYITQQAEFTASPFIKPFDCVVANLPFHARRRGFTSIDARKNEAYCMPTGVLTSWLDALWRHSASSLHILLHTAEADIVKRWARDIGVPFHCVYLVSHPERLAKRVIFHIGQRGDNLHVPTYKKPLRHKILYEGVSLKDGLAAV
ncbi:MAG: methyltransferase [Alphaproteobacteria bacterium]|nr:methyltransferase [Alphaproteobacteria bacterium]MDD9920333.1 methyltransferase [Alphaproteobacteria bacterium]